MRRFAVSALLAASCSVTLLAQQPAPEANVDALNLGELQEATNLLRANYLKPSDVDERAIARATLSGLLAKLDNGATLLASRTVAETPFSPHLPDMFHAETLGEHTGYARLGALTKDHLAELDKALKGFSDQKVAAVILDLRATGGSGDFDLAADVARRFTPKGEPLFSLRKPNANQERLFTSNDDPLFAGLVIVVVDHDTSGAAEVIPAVIRQRNRAMIVGDKTNGRAVEYADLGLAGGRVLRVAVSQAVLPGNAALFPDGVKPDVSAPLSREDKVRIFTDSAEGGLGPFVFETERPHMSEAALVSGANPELDAARDAQEVRRKGGAAARTPLRDVPLQRALDLVSTISVFAAP